MKKWYKVIICIILFLILFGVYFMFVKKENAQVLVEPETIIAYHEDYMHIKDTNYLIEFNFELEGDIPSSKADGEKGVIVKISVGDEDIELFGTIKVQGTSTAYWPKKNWTLKLYKDIDHTESIKLKVGDSIISNKWVLKADWKDPTQLRNYISYNLWGDMLSTREKEVNSSSIKVDGALGYPYTHPSRVLINGEHYGIHLLLIAHDISNYNIDKDNENHMYFEFDARAEGFGYSLYRTWKKFQSRGIDLWIDSYHPENEDITDKQKEAIDNLGKFVNSSLSVFKEDFDKHFDKLNIIDMMLYQEILYDWDGYAADIELVTYDLEKFYILPWDKDNTFGLYKNTSGIQEGSENILVMNYLKEEGTFTPWYKTYISFTDDVESRYAELRDKDIFTASNLESHIDTMYKMYTDEMWLEEKERWAHEKRVAEGETSREQIIDWFTKRIEMLDKHFNYMV